MKLTQEHVIAWARIAGLPRLEETDEIFCLPSAISLATLAYEAGRKDENEACARVCDEKVEAEYATGKVDHNEMGWTQACAIAIRARGNK